MLTTAAINYPTLVNTARIRNSVHSTL